MNMSLFLGVVFTLLRSGLSIGINHVPDQFVDNGGFVTLACIVSGTVADTHVSWTRTNSESTRIITVDNIIIAAQYSNRYTLRNEGVSSRTHTIIISNAQLEDAGTWTCNADSSSASASDSHTLTVLTPPKIVAISNDLSDITLDYNYTLFCNATGSPEPTIKWRRLSPQTLPNGLPFEIGRLFNLTNVTANHRGLYECIASNGRGESARGTVKISIIYKPVVKPVRESIILAKNVAGNISCSCEANPKVTRDSDVEWYKGITRLQATDIQNYIMDVENKDKESDRTVAVLTIRNVTSTRAGDYMCKFINRHGSSTASIDLRVGVVADPKAGMVRSLAMNLGPTSIGVTVIMVLITRRFRVMM